jgi:hypothetical protein
MCSVTELGRPQGMKAFYNSNLCCNLFQRASLYCKPGFPEHAQIENRLINPRNPDVFAYQNEK